MRSRNMSGEVRMGRKTSSLPSNDCDDALLQLYPLYERSTIYEVASVEISQLQVDSSGTLMAVVDVEGVISIWLRQEGVWKRQSSWRYRFNESKPRLPSRETDSHDSAPNNPFTTSVRPMIILRWCHSRHGRFLAMAASNKRKVHIFGENEQDKLQRATFTNMKRAEPLIRWHRKHSMMSAGNVTEMQFGPPHFHFTLATATQNGIVVMHRLENLRDIKSWIPYHAIDVFHDQPINCLTWNQNPIYELPVLVASTSAMDAHNNRRIALFAVNSPVVRPEENMCFEVDNYVSCVSFAPSNGLNESCLAVGVGRRIFLYTFRVEEFPVQQAEIFTGDGTIPLIQEDAEEALAKSRSPNEVISGRATSSAIGVVDKLKANNSSSSLAQSQPNPRIIRHIRHGKELHSSASPRQTGGHIGKNLIVGSATSIESDNSPILPPQFFDGSAKESTFIEEHGERISRQTNVPDEEDEIASGPIEELRGHFDDDHEVTTDEEEEVDANDIHKATMWSLKWVAVFRESSAVRSIHWNVNPDGFTAEFCDGKLRSYKWCYGCVWVKSAELYPRTSAQLDPCYTDF